MPETTNRPSIDPRWLIGVLIAIIPISVGWISSAVRDASTLHAQVVELTRRIDNIERNAISKEEYILRSQVVDAKLSSIDSKLGQIVDHLASLPSARRD